MLSAADDAGPDQRRTRRTSSLSQDPRPLPAAMTAESACLRMQSMQFAVLIGETMVPAGHCGEISWVPRSRVLPLRFEQPYLSLFQFAFRNICSTLEPARAVVATGTRNVLPATGLQPFGWNYITAGYDIQDLKFWGVRVMAVMVPVVTGQRSAFCGSGRHIESHAAHICPRPPLHTECRQT